MNCAAYTAVDRAEQEPDRAFAVNRDGPANLARACAAAGAVLLHLSTDYVFDGTKSGPYREDDAAAPLGVYGGSKWAGEEAVRQTLPAHLILRVSWVFGATGGNFVKTMLRLAREREELRVVDDQHGCPTHAGAIAATLLTLAERLTGGPSAAYGTYHFCNPPPVTWHGFAGAIIERARALTPIKTRTIVPIATQDYPLPARRPANSVLDCTRLHETFGLTPEPWQAGLDAVLKEVCG